jgi:hypothetical protein
MLRPEMDWVDSRQRGFISMLDLWVTSSFAFFRTEFDFDFDFDVAWHSEGGIVS